MVPNMNARSRKIRRGARVMTRMATLRTMSYNNLAWWLKSAGALKFARTRTMSNYALNFRNNHKIYVI